MKPHEKWHAPQSHPGITDYMKVPTVDLLGLEHVCGQTEVISRLKTYAEMYKMKGETPEHILLTGGDGLGKRTISRAFAKSYSRGLRESESREFKRAWDLTAMLTSLDVGEAFILLNLQDLKEQVSEVLVHALEEFQISLIIGKGPGARIHPFYLNRFTFIATAPNETAVSPDLLRCFSLRLALRTYKLDELEQLVALLANENGLTLAPEVIGQIADVCEGSPNRIAQLLRRFARLGKKEISLRDSSEALSAFGLLAPPRGETNNPKNLGLLSGTEFEKLISVLLEKMGFRAEMTKASGDGGIDIVANLTQPLVGGRYLIQCKRFDVATQIGAPLVREFYGALVADRNAVKGVFITTSSFTSQARDFAQSLPLELIDGHQLQILLEQYECP